MKIQRVKLTFNLTQVQVLNKLSDAWIGRIAGCLLGKPVPIDTYIDQFTYQFITDQGVVSIPNEKIGEYTLYSKKYA